MRVLDFVKVKQNKKKEFKTCMLVEDRKFEVCVSCKTITNVLVDTPICERNCYILGAGQLCRECCIELYGTDDLRMM